MVETRRLLKRRYTLGGIIGMLTLLILLLNPSVFAQNPNDVIINEYNEGTSGSCAAPEWVEFLVVNGPITMRNWVLTDNEDENYASGGTEGNITFADDPVFDNIPTGAYIVLYIGDGTDDTNHADRAMALYTGNPLLTMTNSFNLNATAGDNIGLYTSLGGTAIDYIAFGNETASPPGNLIWTSNIAGTRDEDAYFSDGVNFNNDDASKWVIDADGAGCQDRTIGSANSGQSDTSLPVELASFTATYTENGVLLRWRTESETNNLGFWIYHSDQIDGEYVRITPVMIRGAGTTAAAQNHEFIDTAAEDGTMY